MDIQYLSNILKPTWIDLQVCKIRGSKQIWTSTVYAERDLGTTHSLTDSISYALPDAPCFDKIDFDRNDIKYFLAERYGGFGVAGNGGGARSGTFNDIQLKGIGPNCLLGIDADDNHSSGSLDLQSALAEIISTNALGKVLPHGVVDVIGLIHLPEKNNVALTSSSKVILVRRSSIRLGHFLRAGNFSPKYSCDILKDIHRIRNVMKTIGSHADCLYFFRDIISRSGIQFGFAQAVRAHHGTLSPSNITIDGQWLDLTLAGFVTAGTNYHISTSFYSEGRDYLSYLIEFAYTFSKYNSTKVELESVARLYNDSLRKGFSLGIRYVLGLDNLNISEDLDVYWFRIMELFKCRIIGNRAIHVRRSHPSNHDEVLTLIRGVFSLYRDISSLPRKVEVCDLPPDDMRQINKFWLSLLCNSKTAPKNEIIAAGVRSLRRFYVSQIHQLTNITKSIENSLISNSPEEMSNTINVLNNIARWAFMRNDDPVVIVEYDSFVSVFCRSSGTFTISEKNYILETKDFEIISAKIIGLDFKEYQHFFISYIEALVCLFRSLEPV